MSGLAPKLPITITLFTDMTTNLLVRLRFPFIGQGVLRFAFTPAPIVFRAALTLLIGSQTQISRCASGACGRMCQRYWLADQQDQNRVRGANLARLASGANATCAPAKRKKREG
jgi:hypothetical protein